MVWMASHRRVAPQVKNACHNVTVSAKLKPEYIEDVSSQLQEVSITAQLPRSVYACVPAELPNEDLPLIGSAELQDRKRLGNQELWIVVDGIVYDCTEFAMEHPGGVEVLKTFHGEDCSWQFWRFHNPKHMRESGRSLRIGRAKGIQNRFAELPRFIGAGKLYRAVDDESA